MGHLYIKRFDWDARIHSPVPDNSIRVRVNANFLKLVMSCDDENDGTCSGGENVTCTIENTQTKCICIVIPSQ